MVALDREKKRWEKWKGKGRRGEGRDKRSRKEKLGSLNAGMIEVEVERREGAGENSNRERIVTGRE
jgi:hypothetical protein